MKKLNILFLIMFLLIGIKNVNAAISGGQSQAFISDNSNLYRIMSDSNKTCSDYLRSINYDVYSQLGFTSKNYIIDFHLEGKYTSGESFNFTYLDISTYSSVYLKGTQSDTGSLGVLSLEVIGDIQAYVYNLNCSTGQLTRVETKDHVGRYSMYILEKRDVGYEFFPSYYQSNFGDVYYNSDNSNIAQLGSFQLVGVYNGSLQQVQYIDDFVGSDYYSKSLLVGNGVGIIPFYSVISGDFSNNDIPYNGEYDYWYVTADTSLFFTPTSEFSNEGIDTNLYMRPVILDQTLSTEQLYNIFGQVDIKLGSYPNYKDLNKHTDYSFYWNNSYNDFFIIPSTYLTSNEGMYQLLYYNNATIDVTAFNQMIVYYNPKVWKVVSFNYKTQHQSVEIKGVNGTISYSRGEVITTRNETLSNTNIVNKPQYGNTSGDNIAGGSNGFLSGLIGNIQGIKNFISSVGSGITTLTDSVSSLVSMSFGFLNQLPVAVSSVLYLCLLLTIVAIILKIFL